MNMGTTLSVYAMLCRDLGRPFIFPGSAKQWECLTDMTDARLLADHVLRAATTSRAANKAFNAVDGDVSRWSWMWGRIAGWFGIEAVPFDGTLRPPERQMADDSAAYVREGSSWREAAVGPGYHGASRCSFKTRENGFSSTSASAPSGCRPSTIASMMSSASKVSRRTRLT